MIRIVCSNVAQRIQTVAELLDMDADVALLQKVGRATSEGLDSSAWDDAWRDRVKLLRRRQVLGPA